MNVIFFGVASPLRDDNLFFGKTRFNVISELYGKYLQGEHGGVFGLRRIGKNVHSFYYLEGVLNKMAE